MAMRRTAWSAKILEVLSDGEWHTYDELVDSAGPLVPPARAIREAEKNRARNVSANGVPSPTKRAWARRGEPLEIGRRYLVVKSLGGLRLFGHVETRDGRARLHEKAR